MPGTNIPSPCVSLCKLDDDDICTGCFRSADEITDWGRAGEQQRLDIWQAVVKRRKELSGDSQS